jgi:hypothetical protein
MMCILVVQYAVFVGTAQFEYVCEAMRWFATDMFDHLAHCLLTLPILEQLTDEYRLMLRKIIHNHYCNLVHIGASLNPDCLMVRNRPTSGTMCL